MMYYNNNKIVSIYDEVCINHKNYKNTPVNKRILKLKELKKNILEHRNEIKNALYDDFGKNSSEVDLTEIFPVISEINHCVNNIKTQLSLQMGV